MSHRVVLLVELLKFILLELPANIRGHLLIHWVRAGDLGDVSCCINLLFKILELNLLYVLSNLLCE